GCSSCRAQTSTARRSSRRRGRRVVSAAAPAIAPVWSGVSVWQSGLVSWNKCAIFHRKCQVGRSVNVSTPPLPQTRNAHSSPWLEGQGTPGRFVEKNAAACRQLYHRAQERLAAHQRRFEPELSAQQELVGRFLRAAQSGEVE